MFIRRSCPRPPWPAQAFAVVSAGMSLASAYAMLFKPGMGHETWLSACLWTFTTAMGLLRAVLLMFSSSPAVLNAASALSVAKVLGHCLKALTIPPKFLQRLFLQGTRHFLTAYTLSYLMEMGFAKIALPWYLAVACSEAHALCLCHIFKLYVPKEQWLRTVIILHIGVVVVPQIVTSFFSFKPQMTMQRSQTNEMSTTQQPSMCSISTAKMKNTTDWEDDTCLVSDSCAQTVDEASARLQARTGSPSPVSAQNNRFLYKSRLQPACSQDMFSFSLRSLPEAVVRPGYRSGVKYPDMSAGKLCMQLTIKLRTSLHVSDLPPNAAELVQNIIRDAGHRCGRTFNVLQTSIRDGCILISTSVITQPRSFANDNQSQSDHKQPLSAMELAEALLPDLICCIHPNPNPSDYFSLQVGTDQRVVAKWESKQGKWVFQEDHTFSKAASRPALGLVKLNPENGASSWQAALHDDEQHPCSCHACFDGDDGHCHTSGQGSSCTRADTIRQGQSNRKYPSTSDAFHARFSVQLVCNSNTRLDIVGSDLTTTSGTVKTKKAISSMPTYHSPHTSARDTASYQLIVQGSCGFGAANIVNGMGIKTDEGKLFALQVEVRLPAASLARHHEGGPWAALQPLTLQLWAGDAWVSTTHCVLPLADTTTQFGWWGNIPASVAVAAAAELQTATETLIEATKHDPADSLTDSAMIQADAQRKGMQELLFDFNCWLASLRTVATVSGHCMVNSHMPPEITSASRPEQQAYMQQTGLTDVEIVQQLQADLLNFASQSNMPALKQLLTQTPKQLLYAPPLLQQYLTWCIGKFAGNARSQAKATHFFHALKAAAVGSACKDCEQLYEHRMRSSLASVYGCSSLAMFVGGLVAVFKEAAMAQSAGILVGLWALVNGPLSYILLTARPKSDLIVRNTTLLLYLLRLFTNVLITAGVIQMLPSVQVQHVKGTWPLLYMCCSLAERTPITGALPPWLITALGVLEASMLYTVTSSQFPQWWRVFWSAMSVLIVPWLLDAHLRSWIWKQQPANRINGLKNMKQE